MFLTEPAFVGQHAEVTAYWITKRFGWSEDKHLSSCLGLLGCERRALCCGRIPFQKSMLIVSSGQHGPPKRWYPTTALHSVTTQKISSRIFTAVKASYLAVYVATFQKFVLTVSSGKHDPPKRRYPTTILHSVTIQKMSTRIFTAVSVSNLAS
jgi:hypothetical protein